MRATTLKNALAVVLNVQNGFGLITKTPGDHNSFGWVWVHFDQ